LLFLQAWLLFSARFEPISRAREHEINTSGRAQDVPEVNAVIGGGSIVVHK
jgi:hypothetical protein